MPVIGSASGPPVSMFPNFTESTTLEVLRYPNLNFTNVIRLQFVAQGFTESHGRKHGLAVQSLAVDGVGTLSLIHPEMGRTQC